MRRSHFAIGMFAMLFMPACAQTTPTNVHTVDAGEQALLIKPEDGDTVQVRRGETFKLQLTSNPTTGYYWYQISPESDTVRYVEDSYEADPAPEGIAGSGGVQIFTYEALAPGRAGLMLSYQRHEGDVAEQVSLRVEVRE